MSSSPTIEPENIPTALKSRKQWVLWKYETRDGEDKPTKVPYQVNGFRASVASSSTWGHFKDAKLAYDNLIDEGYAGIAYVIAERDPFTGIDLDDVVDEDRGIEPWAAEIVERLNSYTEFSPSGKGLRIFIKAQKPGPRCRTGTKPGFEVYDGKRLLSLTGNRLPDTPEMIEDRQAELDKLYAETFPKENTPGVKASPGKSSVEDGELLGKILASKQATDFEALWDGDVLHHPSTSEADQHFCNILAFWTGRDGGQMDRLFRSSGRMRPKWDEKRGRETYGEMTISKAISDTAEVYKPSTTVEETESSLEELKERIAEDPIEALGDPLVLKRLIGLRRTSPIAYDMLEKALRAFEVKSSTLRKILDEEEAKAAASCESCNAEPEAPEDVKQEAKRIIAEGRSFEYLYKIWQSRHLGDGRAGKAMLAAFGAQCCSSTNGVHVQLNGPRSSGKSHAMETAIYLLPQIYVLSGSLSDKALFYYSANMPPGSVVALDDVTYTDGFAQVQKRCTTGFQTGASHTAVVDTVFGKDGRRFETKPRMAFITTAVDRQMDEQLRNRLWSIDADSSPEHKLEVLDFLKRRDAGLFNPNDEDWKTEVCREIFRDLKSHLFETIIPFAERLQTLPGLDERAYNIISDTTKALAAYRYTQRDFDDQGRLLATEEDFLDAKRIFDATEGHSDVKYTAGEIKVLDALIRCGYQATMSDLCKITSLSNSRIDEILRGRGRGEQKRHGLMSKAPISREQTSDSWTYDEEGNKRKTVTQFVYYLNTDFRRERYASLINLPPESSGGSVGVSVGVSVDNTNNSKEVSVVSVVNTENKRENKNPGTSVESEGGNTLSIHSPPKATETTETSQPIAVMEPETTTERATVSVVTPRPEVLEAVKVRVRKVRELGQKVSDVEIGAWMAQAGRVKPLATTAEIRGALKELGYKPPDEGMVGWEYQSKGFNCPD